MHPGGSLDSYKPQLLPRQEPTGFTGTVCRYKLLFHSNRHTHTEKLRLLWKHLVKSADWDGSSTVRDKCCPAQDFPFPHQALCLAAHTQASRGLFCRAAGRSDTSLTHQPEEMRAYSTPSLVSMVTKRVERLLRASELVVNSILCEVLLKKLGRRISLPQRRAVPYVTHYAVTCAGVDSGDKLQNVGLHMEDIQPL